jgi:hypothetical protein
MENRNFHNESSDSFVNKTAAMAKFAGIAAIGIAAIPYVGKGVGFVGSSFAKGLLDGNGILRKTMGSIAGVEDSRMLFSDSFNFLADSVPQTKRIFLSTAARDSRREILASSLKDVVHEDSFEMFEKNRAKIANAFTDFVHGNEEKLADSYLSDSTLKRFMDSTKGIKFKHIDNLENNPSKILEAHRQHLRKPINEAMVHSKAATVQTSDFFKGTHGQDNFETLAKSIHTRLNRTSRIERKTAEVLGYDKSHKLLTVGDLRTTHRAEAEKYFSTVGIKPLEGHDRVDTVTNKAFAGVKGLFEGVSGQPYKTSQEYLNLLKTIEDTQTGLALKDGQVISLAHTKNVRRNLGRAARSELQLPLMPGLFNIPGTVGQFMSPDSQQVRNLGLLKELPELRKMGLTQHFGDTAVGFSIGDSAFGLEFGENIKISQLGGTDQRFTFLNNRRSKALSELQQARLSDDSIVDATKAIFQESNLFEGFKKTFFNTHQRNPAMRGAQSSLFDLVYHDDQFKLKPKIGNDLGTAFSAVLHPNGTGVTADTLHPNTILSFMNKGGLDNLPEGKQLDLYRQLFAKGSEGNFDISGQLNKFADAIETGAISANFGSDIDKGYAGKDYLKDLIRLSRSSSDAASLFGELTSREGGGTSFIDKYSSINKFANSTFTKALADFESDPTRIYDTANYTQSKVERLAAGFIGKGSASKMQMDLQKGILHELVKATGAAKVEQLGGAGFREAMVTAADGTNPLLKRFLGRRLGVNSSNELDLLLDSVGGYGSNFTQGLLGSDNPSHILSVLGDTRKINAVIGDPLVSLMIAEQQRAEAMLLGHMADSDQVSLNLIKRIGDDSGAAEAIRKRSSFLGTGFDFEEKYADIGNYAVLPQSGKSVGDMFSDPESIRENIANQASRGFGVFDFLKSSFDPKAPMGYAGTVFTTLGHLPNEVLHTVGLSLPEQYMSTMGAGHLGFYATRILPLYVGMEAYKNFNANAHSYGLAGIDGAAANLVANTNLAGAKIKDHLGLTTLNKKITYGIPGLDMYFHPRSEEEYREHIFYGQEEVRMGRGFAIGNRNPIYGGAVEYVRPSFYARWKSGWTEASNIQMSNPEYSFLPSLSHPFAPIKRLLHPHWQQDLTHEDRPYGTLDEYIAYAKDHEVTQNRYLPTARGRGVYGSSDKSFVEFSNSGFTGGGGYGGGGGGYGGGHGAGGGFNPAGGGGVSRYNATGVSYNNIITQGGYNKAPDGYDVYRHSKVGGLLTHLFHDQVNPMGFYAGLLKMTPFFPEESKAFTYQQADKAFSSKNQFYMGEYGEAAGPLGEIYRRFIQEERQESDAWNPLPNNQPSFMPARFRTGDPIARVAGGHYNVVGDAFFKLHPYIVPMKARGSMIGGTEDEIVQKLIDPVGSETNEAAEARMAYGTRAHKVIMRQMRDAGILYGAEVAGYDKKHNISATVETIVRGETGNEVVEIKTRSAKNFETDNPKYEDQLMFYMYLNGAKRGHIAHVNQEDPTQVRVKTYDYDPHRMEEIFARLERARNRVKQLVDEGKISPYETLGLLERLEVLARTAPESPEFDYYKRLAEDKGGFGGQEQRRYELALKNAESLRKRHNIYPYRSAPTETRKLRLLGVTDKGELVTEEGSFKLAGVKFDQQAFSLKDPETIFAEMGIKVGDKIPVTLLQGQFQEDVIASGRLEAVVGGLNSKLLHSDLAHPDYENRNPLSGRVLGRVGPIDRVVEHLVHGDNMFSNKFLRVRSGLEQFERGEVFGTDDFSLKSFKDNYVDPTVNSVINKNPVVAGLQAGMIVSIFLKSAEKKKTFGGAAGAVAFVLSSMRVVSETLTGEKWTPKRFKRANEFEEYYDILRFVKEASLSEEYTRKKSNDEDVQATFEMYAKDASRKAQNTMYAFDAVKGTLKDALRVIPNRHREVAESVILAGSNNEKRKFYDLLPDSEKRVLGKFLGVDVDDLPKKPSLDEYFRKHFLPDASWDGWDRDVDLDDIKTRAKELENIKIQRPSRKKVERAKVFTKGISVPRMDNPTHRNVKRDIQKLVNSGNFGKLDVKYSQLSSPKQIIDMTLNIEQTESISPADRQRVLHRM